jgi:hypothetical protein
VVELLDAVPLPATEELMDMAVLRTGLNGPSDKRWRLFTKAAYAATHCSQDVHPMILRPA